VTTTDRVGGLLDELQARGERITVARRALVESLVGSDRHLTADELTAEVQRRHPAVHRATIYRTLERLRELGVVEHSHLGHGPAVYHLHDEVHQHLVCEACGAVVEVPATLFRSVERKLRDEHGFVMRPLHFAVVGRCRACAPP
jgi:Fe2+ or Zn2+ uptake regulation protein